MRKLFLLQLLLIVSLIGKSQVIVTVAGNGIPSFSGDGGQATNASLDYSRDVIVDSLGNVYFTDCNNNRVRKINTSGVITTVAGNGTAGYSGDGGPATAAEINGSYGLALDDAGNLIIADYWNNVVRKVNTSGIITTIAGTNVAGYSGDGGPATLAKLWIPNYVCTDHHGNVYITDNQNQRIRKVNAAGIITTYAGTGMATYDGDGVPATDASINYPGGIKMDVSGNMYIADGWNNRVRKIDTNGIISTIGGNGSSGFSGDGFAATLCTMDIPLALCVDRTGNVYFSDSYNERIRKISSSGIITTIAGNGSEGYSGEGVLATASEINEPDGVYCDNYGNIFIAEYTNYRVREIVRPGGHPIFTRGDTIHFNICEGSSAYSIDSDLAVTDSVAGDILTWSTIRTPTHGTLVDAFSVSSTGTTVTPTGLSYTPFAGYTGNDTFKVKVSTGTFSDSITFYVVVDPTPHVQNIIGVDTICMPSETGVYYADSTSGGVWSCTNSNATIISTGYLVGLNPGIDTVLYSVTYSCGTVTVSKAIDLLDYPYAGAIIGHRHICVGDSATLTDTSASNAGIWNVTNSFASIGSLSGVVTGIEPGIDTITYVVSNFCGVTSTWSTITVLTPRACDTVLMGIQKLSVETGIELFPNPASDFITLRSIDDIGNIQILNEVGQIIVNDNFFASIAQLDIQYLPSGMYYIKYKYNDCIAYKKFIKQ